MLAGGVHWTDCPGVIVIGKPSTGGPLALPEVMVRLAVVHAPPEASWIVKVSPGKPVSYGVPPFASWQLAVASPPVTVKSGDGTVEMQASLTATMSWSHASERQT